MVSAPAGGLGEPLSKRFGVALRAMAGGNGRILVSVDADDEGP